MFEKPFSFEGRIRRSEYGISFIIYVILNVLISFISEAGGEEAIIFSLIFTIPNLWFFWAQGAKRCHDVGNSGWYQIIPFYVFWMLFQDGKVGVNKYGDNPKGIQSGGYGQSNSAGNTGSVPPPIGGNTGSYSGGYNGGHNNHATSSSSTNPSTSTNVSSKGYQSGDLYN